ncbi:hypothetical protein [Nostoc sp.]|uniref:hypothetical protein n=1 Tax=Nostoc sp. TaxID=1180 RepID=UPI002FFA6D3E
MSQGSTDLTDAMKGSNTVKLPIDIDPQTAPNPEQSIEGQWYKANTVYQILEVRKPGEEKREGKNIVTTIVAKERGDGSENTQSENFNKYSLDQQTIDKLQDYPKKGDGKSISSYLPSSGVIFSKGFFDALSSLQTKKVEQNEITNFYHPIRTLLYSRKISQLISKTWWSYLEAKENKLWDKFIAGEWEDIINYKKDINNPNYGFDILDGLIAREIFMYGGAEPPDYPDPGNSFYSPLKDYSEKRDQARFLILPSSRSWQGISLSLLLAGQAYYQTVDKKYHQISQPIFSTGEITMLHSLEVDWGKFQGDIKELIINHEKPWVGYHIVIPYPPIPSGADIEAIKTWAGAEEEPGKSKFPFYRKANDKYLIDVDYFKPPYPYIPLSCT